MEFLKLIDGPAVTECYQRRESVLPQQALALANSELTLRQGRILARSLEERWEYNRRAAAFVLALGQSRRAGNSLDSGRNDMSPTFDPSALVSLLQAGGVEFVIIGGMAMASQGVAHVTLDLDLCYNRTPGNFAALAAAFA